MMFLCSLVLPDSFEWHLEILKKKEKKTVACLGQKQRYEGRKGRTKTAYNADYEFCSFLPQAKHIMLAASALKKLK